MNPNSYTYNRNSQNNAFTFDTIIIAHTYTYPKDTPYWNEAGNRTRKTAYRSHDPDPEPLPEKTEDLPNGWDILSDEYYSRDVTGKEIAIYSSYTLQYWNVWSGGEIVGRVNPSEGEPRYYYLKDHLGSIRVVLDNSKTIVSANDGVYPDLIGNAWGWYLENRTYSTTNTKNKFTGKERDLESSYDYFGARYYDARIGRWGSVDPLFEKHIQFTPYNYVLGNPMMLIDPDGRQVHFSSDEEVFYVTRTLDPAIGRFIEITNDLEILHVATPKRGMDGNFSNLWAIETNNKPVSFKIVNDDEEFSYQNSPEKKLEPSTTSFQDTKKATGIALGGYTLPSGLCATPEEPETFSPNNETKILINRKYGVKEGVKSMGEELMHAAKYISGDIWKHYDGKTKTYHPEINEAAERALELSEKNYKKWGN